MPEIIIYLLKANVAIVLFYMGYRLLLRKLTFYNLNRFYLLFALAFSTTYPLVDVKKWLAKQPDISVEALYIIPDWQQVPTDTISLWPYLAVLFWLGVGCFAIRLFVRLGSLWNLHRVSRPSTWKLFRYRQVFGNVMPFSFWRHIYLNVHNHGEAELGEIFEHEQIHVNELHTVDVLLVELCSVLCWFNPGAWLMRHAVHENLEFITDRRVLQRGVDKKAYQYSLLKINQYAAANPGMVNHFSLKSLKRRIMMMNKQDSSRLQLGKYVLAIPVIAVFVLAFTFTKAYQDDSTDDRFGNVGTAVFTQADSIVSVDGQAVSPVVYGQPLALKRVEVDTTDANKKITGAQHSENATDVPKPRVKITGVVVRGNESSIDTSKLVKGTVVGRVSLDSVNVIALRGRSTSDREPLYILDGKPMTLPDGISALDPNTIESISVLKDASATALYGPKAVNGVVLITTKVNPTLKVRVDTVRERLAISGNRLEASEKGKDNSITVVGKQIKFQADSLWVFRGTPAAEKEDFNGALIMIDGKEKSAKEFRELSPNDIQSVNVLKGESATKKYGEKGAKGTIEVTTKK